MIASPPLDNGSLHDTVALPMPGVPETSVGASGIVTGIAVDGEEAEPCPTAFVAFTVTVYTVPFVRPVITIGGETPDASYVVVPSVAYAV